MLAALLLLAAVQPKTMHWTIDGMDREAVVILPAVASPKPPLLVFFHGHGGHASRAWQRYAFQDHWPKAIVVYPQGLPIPSAIDPAGKDPGWQREIGQAGDRDVKLFDAIARSFPDNGGVFVVGHSNGAFMSYVLWAERGKGLRGIAVCAGKLMVNVKTPVPILHIAGEKDPLVSIAEQRKSMDEERRIDGSRAESIIHPGGHEWPPWASRRIVEFFH